MRPITTSQAPSTLPMSGMGGGSQPVSIRDGFLQFLPSRSLIFFQRAYFADYPKPIQKAGFPPYPFPVPVARIQAPARQAIIIRNTAFSVYKATNIAPGDTEQVSRARAVGYFGFQTNVGNRGMTDFNTNITAQGQRLALTGFGDPDGTLQNTSAPTPGQGSFYPFPGSSQLGLENFAFYARPGQNITMTVQILKPQPYETTSFSAEITGYVVGEHVLDKVLSRLTSDG